MALSPFFTWMIVLKPARGPGILFTTALLCGFICRGQLAVSINPFDHQGLLKSPSISSSSSLASPHVLQSTVRALQPTSDHDEIVAMFNVPTSRTGAI
ncbi:hypothetical protein ASPFODRAFT_386472 [Aspergillus luchuensis CBS 106.47]|uniref:Uncharacterized protein n=1 Tax=Aspergillus luchuensis (strain CBS 106.47) TaxID=1137211 RepID=A0A1M3T3A3_ASPLC|nr:hypothetical protein ASPFODRAFT_386472 [Aspergillus luchuensis CBS 106.47]